MITFRHRSYPQGLIFLWKCGTHIDRYESSPKIPSWRDSGRIVLCKCVAELTLKRDTETDADFLDLGIQMLKYNRYSMEIQWKYNGVSTNFAKRISIEFPDVFDVCISGLRDYLSDPESMSPR